MNTKLEQLFQERDSLSGDLGDFVRSSCDLLQGLNRPQLRKLMEWEFSVDDTHRAPPAKPGRWK